MKNNAQPLKLRSGAFEFNPSLPLNLDQRMNVLKHFEEFYASVCSLQLERESKFRNNFSSG